MAKPRVRIRTYEDYRWLLSKYVRPVLGDRRLDQIRPLNVSALYNGTRERGLTGRTVHVTHNVLRSAFKQAVRWGMLASNPAENVDLVTGMRPAEILGLRWSDINGRSVVVRHTLVRTGKTWRFEPPKTDKSRRTIPLPDSLVRALSAHRARQAEIRLQSGPRYQDLDLVFAASNGVPLDGRNLVRRHLKPILQRAKLPDSIRFYDLRHTCASLLLADGENAKVVSERLGHAGITLTLDTYCHVMPGMQSAATDRIEALIQMKGPA